MFDPAGPGARHRPWGLALWLRRGRARAGQMRAVALRGDPHRVRPSRCRSGSPRWPTSSPALVAEYRPSARRRSSGSCSRTTRGPRSRVGQASGLALVAAAGAGVPVAQYSPNEVKLAVTGDGRADKAAVQKMVTRLLGLREVPTPGRRGRRARARVLSPLAGRRCSPVVSDGDERDDRVGARAP